MPGVLRLLLTVLIAVGAVVLMFPLIIKRLRQLHVGQNIRPDGPQSHLEKAGTPTMGGIMIIAAVVLTVLIVGTVNRELLLAVLVTVALGVVGFIDDYTKVIKKRSLGLRAGQKIILQLVVAFILAWLVMNTDQLGTSIYMPFTAAVWDLGWGYVPFVMLVVVGSSNAVNLTDGLDGLAASVTVIAAAGLAWLCWQQQQDQLVLFSLAVAGAALGFLIFNHYPARIFMGDTGSLALGGALAAVAVLTRTELFLLFIGLVYVLEAVSVMIQVSVFKAVHKRVFLMSPLHHHFELLGYHEARVVSLFAAIAVVGTLLGIAGWMCR